MPLVRIVRRPQCELLPVVALKDKLRPFDAAASTSNRHPLDTRHLVPTAALPKEQRARAQTVSGEHGSAEREIERDRADHQGDRARQREQRGRRVGSEHDGHDGSHDDAAATARPDQQLTALADSDDDAVHPPNV